MVEEKIMKQKHLEQVHMVGWSSLITVSYLGNKVGVILYGMAQLVV